MGGWDEWDGPPPGVPAAPTAPTVPGEGGDAGGRRPGGGLPVDRNVAIVIGVVAVAVVVIVGAVVLAGGGGAKDASAPVATMRPPRGTAPPDDAGFGGGTSLPEHTGGTSRFTQEPTTAAEVRPPADRWDVDLRKDLPTAGRGMGDTDRPIIADGKVFLLHGNVVAAYDLGSGTRLWLAPKCGTAHWPAYASSSVAGGRVLVLCGDTVLRGLSEADGSTVWEFKTDGERHIDDVRLHGDAVGVSYEGEVRVLDLADGRFRWNKVVYSRYNAFDFDDQRLYVSYGNELLALEMAHGKEQWYARVPTASVVVDGGTVYVGTFQGEAVAVDPATGTARWRMPIPAPDRYVQLLAAGPDRLVTFDVDDTVAVWQPGQGAARWSMRTSGLPVVDGNRVVLSGRRAVKVVDTATGAVVAEVPAELTAPAYGADGKLAWATGDPDTVLHVEPTP